MARTCLRTRMTPSLQAVHATVAGLIQYSAVRCATIGSVHAYVARRYRLHWRILLSKRPQKRRRKRRARNRCFKRKIPYRLYVRDTTKLQRRASMA